MSEHSEAVRQIPQERTAGEMFEELARFDGPPEQFLARLLEVQCRVGAAQSGAVLRIEGDKQANVLAAVPPLSREEPPPDWLASSLKLAPQIISSGKTTVRPLHAPDDLYGRAARRHLVMVPLGVGAPGLAVFVIEAENPAVVASCRDRLETTVAFLSLYEMRSALQRRQADFQRLRAALEILPCVNDHDRFIAAAMALCNEAAARWSCDRASLGFLRGRYVQLKAMSHTEKFSRKMKLIQDIEAAMEECLDQDTEILYPADKEATSVSRAAGELSRRHGPTSVLCVPIRRGGEAVAVLTLERASDGATGGFKPEEVESLRLACELCTARLVSLYRHDRWFGARLAGSARKGVALLLGPEHTWKKVIAVLVLAGAAFLVLAKGDYTAEATFVFEATERQVIPAPFDGYIKKVHVRPDDEVVANETVLAELDPEKLRLEAAEAAAERRAYLKLAAAAIRDDKRAEAEIARAQAERVAARIALLEHHIAQAQIKSPISGKVVTGDLKRQVGAPVKTGTVMFEIAPVTALRAELSVPEDQIAEVRQKQSGELATASYPDRRFKFVVERIHPVAEVVSQRNVFKVEATLSSSEPWMRPGMEGLAKVHLGRRSYAWLWTRRLVNWLRMKLWL